MRSKALTAFPDDDVILLLGGHDKGTPLTDFARVVIDNVRSVVCFGDAREHFTAAMDEADVDGDVDIAQADDLRGTPWTLPVRFRAVVT